MAIDSGGPAGNQVRLYDIDWLRIMATAAIFIYHSGRFFDTMEPWHIKNPQLTDALTVPMAIGSQFAMPLFFVLSGISTWNALRSRSAGDFLRRRVPRLLVPVVTLGWFVLSPPQVYIERVTAQNYNVGPFSGTFWQYIPHYFEGLYGQGGNFAWTGMHLWYLFWLLCFTVASLPLFLYMLDKGKTAVAALSLFLQKPGAIFLLALGPILTELLVQPSVRFLGWTEGGWKLGTHWVLLGLGFLLASDAGFRPALLRQRWLALGLAVLSIIPLGLLAPRVDSLVPGTVAHAGFFTLRTANGWFWLVAILGFAVRHLNVANRALAIAGEAVLPFYILHQTVIVILAYAMMGWSLAIGIKYPLLVLSAFAVCISLYALVIRRSNIVRFLFGMNPKASQKTAE